MIFYIEQPQTVEELLYITMTDITIIFIKFIENEVDHESSIF